MRNLSIRLLVVLGGLTMTAIVAIQVYWVSQAISSQEEQFNLSVQMALRNVVESLCQIAGNDIPSIDPIEQLSNNYFIGRTNNKIDIGQLHYLLKAELQKRGIKQDYEFGVYDCQTDRMVYGDFVSLEDLEKDQVEPKGELPKLINEEYYFGVFFPGRSAGIVKSLGIWKVTTVLTVLIFIFFTYALFVILRQKRLSEVQKDFINNMTHEFKTPLATLRVSADVLIKESKTNRQERYASIVFAETERLEKHVQQMLETSLLDYGKKTFKTERLHPLPVIQKLAERFQIIRDIRIHENLQLQDGPTVLGDPLIFENILFNVLDNAVKYGDSEVWVKAYVEQGQLVIEVTNDGVGIPRKEQKRIFKKFYRIHHGDRHDVKGFGLGLYFVKAGMRVFHGHVRVSSAGQFTTFTLIFPIHKDTAKTAIGSKIKMFV